MLHLSFCPRYSFLSFFTAIILFDIMVFTYSCFQGLQKPGTLLQISTSVLENTGANYPLLIYRNGEVWRWLTACFLHADFLHIFFNSISSIMIGASIEYAYGGTKTGLIYITSGIIGNIFRYSLEISMFCLYFIQFKLFKE